MGRYRKSSGSNEFPLRLPPLVPKPTKVELEQARRDETDQRLKRIVRKRQDCAERMQRMHARFRARQPQP